MSAYDELIAPITAADIANAWRSREFIFRRTGDTHRFADVLSWQSLSQLIVDGGIPAHRLRVRTATMAIPPVFWREGERVNAGKFAELVRSGISIIATALHEHVPALQSLCQSVGATTRDRIRAGAIVTTGSGGALPCHFDPEDLIILQVEGAKRWQIYAPLRPRGPGEVMMSPPGSKPIFDDVLRAGDILVLPSGYLHHCENQPGISMHLGIAFNPLNAFRAARNLLRELRKDPSFWTPLDRFESAEQQAKHEAALKAHWVDLIQKADLLELAGETEAAEEPANIYDT